LNGSDRRICPGCKREVLKGSPFHQQKDSFRWHLRCWEIRCFVREPSRVRRNSKSGAGLQDAGAESL